MRFPFERPALGALAVLCGALSSGCAHTFESSHEDRLVVAVDNDNVVAGSTEVTEVRPRIVTEPSAAARPRLSQTVTLGQGTTEAVYAQAAQAAQNAQGTNGTNVVVNNSITVVGSPPVGYGGYGGYGYGGYSGAHSVRDGRSVGRLPSYAPTGWEGAGRTAAPGQTPHVGGNWSPAPSHGPRQMK